MRDVCTLRSGQDGRRIKLQAQSGPNYRARRKVYGTVKRVVLVVEMDVSLRPWRINTRPALLANVRHPSTEFGALGRTLLQSVRIRKRQ
jgi:hypothetical protein